MKFAARMQVSGAMGLPLRIALPLFVGIAAVFLAIMGFLVRMGLGNSEAPLGPTSKLASSPTERPITIVTDAPGTFTVPQTGTGPAAAASGALPGTTVGGGGPPAAVRAQLDDLRARLHANPNDLSALVGVADLEFDAGRFAASLPFFRRALELDPGNPDVRTDEATALHQVGRDLEALHELDVVLAARPTFPPALFNRAIVLRSIGRRTEAVAAFRHFIAAAPDDPRVEDARSNLQDLGER
jgi:tetratricopeptide (TPR) repeat protein